MNRAHLRPGQVVEVRQRYLVTQGKFPDGRHKFRHLHGDDTLVVVRGRWFVRRIPAQRFLDEACPVYWVAGEGSNDVTDSVDREWAAFDTHADAIAWADRKARQP